MECGKEISDKASACPNCGCPILIQNTQESQLENKDLICPEFPDDLDLGKSIMFFATGIPMERIEGGIITVDSCKKGLRIIEKGRITTLIHKSQIISLEELTKQEIQQKDKSVIGRAIVGGVLTGGIGAIVGGMSGLNNQKLINKYCFIINYWDIETKKPVSFILNPNESNLSFINKFKKNVLNE